MFHSHTNFKTIISNQISMPRRPHRRRVVFRYNHHRITVPVPNAEVELSHLMLIFEQGGFERRLREGLQRYNFDEQYLQWYEAMKDIGMGVVARVLKERGFIEECLTSRELYFEVKENDENHLIMFWRVEGALRKSSEVMLQLYNQTREADIILDDVEKINLYQACDEIVTQYGMDFDLEIPEHIQNRFQVVE